jgi:hypothetical protein
MRQRPSGRINLARERLAERFSHSQDPKQTIARPFGRSGKDAQPLNLSDQSPPVFSTSTAATPGTVSEISLPRATTQREEIFRLVAILRKLTDAQREYCSKGSRFACLGRDGPRRAGIIESRSRHHALASELAMVATCGRRRNQRCRAAIDQARREHQSAILPDSEGVI